MIRKVSTTPVNNWEETNNFGTWGGDNIWYTYDALNRLVEEYDCQQSLTTTYTYDSLGNCLSKKDSRGLVTYAYNERNQLVDEAVSNEQTNYKNKNKGK